MLRSEITITDEDIAYAERILFGKTGCFDDERKIFIRNLETIDLQAVPGSGKTTALLAKLLILERYLPFEEGTGILVLSHTNNAVDIIRDRISRCCPKLFTYPNFVGTIQSFVNQFLAFPYYVQLYGKRPIRIDDEIYNENVSRPHKAIFWLKKHPYQENAVLYKSRLNKNDELVIEFDGPSSFPLRPTTQTYISLLEMKKKLRTKGYLCYDDAYYLAHRYLFEYPTIRKLIQKRFELVFVDEMQDMDKHQYDLLEQLFYDDGNSSSAYQRIGDKNQAIFSSVVKLEDIWTKRETTLEITGSRRLSPTIAHVVQPFGLTPQVISGDNKINKNGSDNNILPHIIEFDDDSITRVIPKFCELVKQLQIDGRIPKNLECPIKAIAWRAKVGQFGLMDYFPGYAKEAVKTKIDYPNLISYLEFPRDESLRNKRLNDIRKGIVNALLKILRLEKVKKLEGKSAYYSEASLHKFLKENDFDFHETFKSNLFLWCKDIYIGNTEKVLEAFKNFIPDFLKRFDKTLEQAAGFVNDTSLPYSANPETEFAPDKPKLNVYRCDNANIEVQIGTVHSAKGETHTATLYLESYYYEDGRGDNAKSFESQRLKEQFSGTNISHQANDRTRQSAKMVYVGFSRPTHFLCFAVHKDRVSNIACDHNGWVVVQA